MELGPKAVSERILDRAERVREIARSLDWRIVGSANREDVAGIVALEKDGVDPDAAVRALRERGVAAACRRARLRFSPHVYCSDSDLERLSETLAEIRT